MKTGTLNNRLNLKQIILFHQDLKLAGNPPNSLLELPEDILKYLVSILRDQTEKAPEKTEQTWGDVLHHLSYHGIIPLIYSRLTQLHDHLKPPSAVTCQMETAFLVSRAKSLRSEKQLNDIVCAFENNQIPYVVLKGPSLSASLYQDPAERPFSDIDILVTESSYLSARKALTGIGYTCLSDRFPHIKKLHADETFVLKKNARSFPVELHWSLSHFYGIHRDISYVELIDETLTVATPSTRFKKLSRVNEFIFAAQHLTEHHNIDMKLIWLYDISLMIRALSFPHDWIEIQNKCEKWKLNLAVQNALKSAVLWFGARLPSGFDDFDTWPKPSASEERAWNYLQKRHKSIYHMLKVRLPSTLPVSDLIRYGTHLILPPREYLKKTYPIQNDFLIPFFYIRRWADLILKMVKNR